MNSTRVTTDLPKLRSLVLTAVDYSLSKLDTIRDDLLASIQADSKMINAPENTSRMCLLTEIYQALDGVRLFQGEDIKKVLREFLSKRQQSVQESERNEAFSTESMVFESIVTGIYVKTTVINSKLNCIKYFIEKNPTTTEGIVQFGNILNPIRKKVELQVKMEENRFDLQRRAADVDSKIQVLEAQKQDIKEEMQNIQSALQSERNSQKKYLALLQETKAKLEQYQKQQPESRIQSVASTNTNTSSPNVPRSQVAPLNPSQRLMNLKISHNGKIYPVALELSITVGENIVNFMRQFLNMQVNDPGDYGFFVSFPTGIWLTNTQKLSKFGIKEGTELELKVRQRTAPKELKEEDIFVKVQVPEDEDVQSMTFKVKNTSLVQDVINQIVKKYKVENPENYGLLLKVETTSTNGIWMDEFQKLNQYNVKTNQILYFHQKPEDLVFKVFPNTLSTTVDPNGIKIPVVLFSMKQCLLRNNGLELEGIFEESGDEVVTKKMRQRLNLGHELIIEEPPQLYCVAGLLKQWYKDLPQKMLQVIKPADTTAFASSQASALKAMESLPEFTRSLLDWLLDLLAETTKYFQKNGMDEMELAITFATSVYNMSNIDAGIAPQVMQNITALLYFLISKRTGNDIPVNFTEDDLRKITSQLKLSSTRLLDLLWDEEIEAEEEAEEYN